VKMEELEVSVFRSLPWKWAYLEVSALESHLSTTS